MEGLLNDPGKTLHKFEKPETLPWRLEPVTQPLGSPPERRTRTEHKALDMLEDMVNY